MKNYYKKWTSLVLLCFLFITSIGSVQAQVVNTESFDATTFVPTGWTDLLSSGTNTWTRVTAGTFPTQSTHTGAGEAKFNSWDVNGGVRSIITPAFPLSANATGAPVSFWMYRDDGYNTTADKIEVFYNTAANLTGAVLLGTVNRAIGLAPTVAANGWYQYSYTIPSTVTASNVYLIFKGSSLYGNNIYIDDVSWTSYPVNAPSVPVQAAGTPTCSAGSALTVTGTPQAGATWYWQTSATGTSTANPAATANTIFANGTYYVRSYYAATNSWSTATSVAVTNFPVATAPPAPVALVNPSCSPAGSSLSVAAAPAGSVYYWQGTTVGGSSNALPATTPYAYSASGTYYLAAYETASGCWSATVGATVTVNTVIPAAPVVTQSIYNVCSGTTSVPVSAAVPPWSSSAMQRSTERPPSASSPYPHSQTAWPSNA